MTVQNYLQTREPYLEITSSEPQITESDTLVLMESQVYHFPLSRDKLPYLEITEPYPKIRKLNPK